MNARMLVVLAGFSITALSGLSACQSIGGIAHSEDQAGREGFVWDVPLDNVDAPEPDRNAVYVQCRDASGRGIELRDELRSALRAQGFRIVTAPSEADYKLEVVIASFDRNPCGDRRDATSRSMSNAGDAAATGAAREAGATGSVSGPLGGLIGDIFGQRIANDSTAKEWSLVADVKLSQKIQGGVETQLRSGKSDRGTSVTARGNSGGASWGTRESTSGQSQAVSVQKDFIEHNARLTAFSSKWGQTEEKQARDVLLPRLVDALAKALPPVG